MRFYVNLFPGQQPPPVILPASGITHSPASPGLLANALINTPVATFELVNGTGRGNWDALTTQPLFTFTPNLRVAELKLARDLTASDIGSFPFQVQYSGEEGMTGPVTDTVTLVVSAVPAGPPTDITVDDATPQVTTASLNNDEIIGVDLVGGAGTGSWSITGSPADYATTFKLSAATGKTTILQLARNMSATDQAKLWQLTFRYSGEGLATALTKNITCECILATGVPTDIQEANTSNLTVGDGASTAKRIATLNVVGGAGTGTWSIQSTTLSKVSLSTTTGRTTNLRTNAQIVAADIGTGKSTVVQYVEGATTLTETVTYDVVPSVPTGITFTTPATLKVGDPAHTPISTLSLVGGTAGGNWTRVTPSWADAELNNYGPNTRSPVMWNKDQIVQADVSSTRKGWWRYTGTAGEGNTVLEVEVPFVIEQGTAPTAPTMSLPSTGTVVNLSPIGTDIATATITNGSGSGTWTSTVTPSTAPLRLVGSAALTRTVELSRALTSSDNGDNLGSITVSFQDANNAFSTVSRTISVTAQAASTGVTWKFGIAGGDESNAAGDSGGCSILDRHNAWLERTTTAQKAKWYTQFCGANGTSWSGLYPTGGGHLNLVKGMIRRGVTTSLSLPVCTKAEKNAANNIETKWNPLLNGNNDTAINNMLGRIKQAYRDAVGNQSLNSFPLVCFRFGWEQTLDSFAWFVGTQNTVAPGKFIEGFRKLSDMARNALPDSKVEFCVQKGYKDYHNIVKTGGESSPSTWTWDIFPGAAYVTHIAIDWYDAYPAGTADNWNTATGMNAQNRDVFNFARGKSRLFGVTEWGLRNKFKYKGEGTSTVVGMGGGADNEHFISGMFKFFQQCETNYPGVLDFECYYQPHEMATVGADGTHATQEGLQHYDAIHSLYWYDGSTRRVNGPWNGRTDGNSNCTNPATCKGVLVGQQNYNLADSNNQKATGFAGAKYKELWGL